MTRDEWKAVERNLRDERVQSAMRGRCEEQGHEYENGLTASFSFVQICKWCGEKRWLR